MFEREKIALQKKKSFVMRKISILTFLNFEKIIPR